MAEGRKNTLIIEYIRYRVCKRQIFNVFESYKKNLKKRRRNQFSISLGHDSLLGPQSLEDF